MSAILSPCGKYRYVLERNPGCKPLVFLMLNPSTADASKDDPTIRRCRRFASDNGYTGIIVVNLYAYRASKPADLWAISDPIGPMNDSYILQCTAKKDVCCAWGANAPKERINAVQNILATVRAKTLCLGTTMNSSPRHPLYVKAEQTLIDY